MKAKFIQDGLSIDITAGENGIAAGDIVINGTLIGVAKTDIAAGAVGAIATEGVYAVKKAASVAFTVGAKVYYNVEGGNATAAETDTLIGVATAAAGAGDEAVIVKIG